MRKLSAKLALPWILAAFIFAGGLGNVFATSDILANYTRWGYPDWFHYVTGGLELTSAALLISVPLRLLGGALCAMIMAAAVGTVIINGEYFHAITPSIVMLLAIIVCTSAWRERSVISKLSSRSDIEVSH